MSLLSDPGNTRILKQLPLPYNKSLTKQQLFNNKQINTQLLINFYQNQGILDINLIKQIIKQAKQIFSMQPNLIYINDPISIIGDIHGQYYDLVNILKVLHTKNKNKNKNDVSSNTTYTLRNKQKYLFLGDYVDRGLFAIQVMILILAMKINQPKRVFVLRGNHQSQQLTTYFNFRHQCIQIYNQSIYQQFIDIFCSFPLAAVVNHRFLCIHGGISTNIKTLQDIMKINRFTQIPQNGLFCDLVWADPIDNQSGKLKGLVSVNQTRGCSYNFGYSLTKTILDKNNLHCIIRAHQAKQEGYQMHKWAGFDKFPPVITIFSAPNYCDFYNNKGALIRIQNNVLQIQQIISSIHPFYLPNGLSLFQWTIPFIAQKMTELFCVLLKSDIQQVEQSDHIMIQLIDKKKIIQALLKMQQEDAQEKMQAIKYHGKVLGQELMNIQQARDYVMNVYNKDFNIQKSIDKINQKRPKLDQSAQTDLNQSKEPKVN